MSERLPSTAVCREEALAAGRPAPRTCPTCSLSDHCWKHVGKTAPALAPIAAPSPEAAEQLRVGRMVAEKDELDTRLRRLTAFIGTPAFDALDTAARTRLRLQHAYMQGYSDVLAERILLG